MDGMVIIGQRSSKSTCHRYSESTFGDNKKNGVSSSVLVTKRLCFQYKKGKQNSIKVPTPVIEKHKLPPIQIFDKNCPLERVNQKFAIFRQNIRKLEFFGNISQKINAY